MSYAYGSSGSRNTSALIVTTGIHVALGLAALYGLGIVKVPTPYNPPPIKTVNIPEKTPDTIPPKATPDLQETWDMPQPVIITAPDDMPPIAPIKPVEVVPIGDGSGAGPIVMPTPPHNPVMAAARIDPRFADRFQPPYPPASLRSEEEGVVVLRVLIGPDGRVKAAELATSSGHDRLDEAAIAHAKRAWRFLPATKDGAPVETWRMMSVRFELKGG